MTRREAPVKLSDQDMSTLGAAATGRMATVAKEKRSGKAHGAMEEEAPEKRRCRTGEQQEEATEEEVEEFFAILRRIQESAANLGAGRGNGAVRRRPGIADEQPEAPTVPAWRWRLSFEWEDFGQAAASSRQVEEDAGSGRKRRTSPPAAEVDGEEEADDGEEDGLRRGFDLNLEPSAAALSCWRQRKRD